MFIFFNFPPKSAILYFFKKTFPAKNEAQKQFDYSASRDPFREDDGPAELQLTVDILQTEQDVTEHRGDAEARRRDASNRTSGVRRQLL